MENNENEVVTTSEVTKENQGTNEKEVVKEKEVAVAKENTNPNQQAPQETHKPKPRGHKNPPRRKEPKSFIAKLKKSVEMNDKIQKNRLNPHYKLNLNSNQKIKIIPLGGLGEIGGNITVFETEKAALLVDVGMSFPSEDMHGVDILVPDFTYLRQIKDKIKGIVITHAHEDHIGAVPYLFKEMQFPLYGTPLALGMISNKFDEHKIASFKNFLNPIEKRKTIKIGEFDVEWMHVTHSIADSSALAITTEAGTIIHSGDFKIDHTPIDGYPTDLHRLAYYGEKGVMLLLSDSTNSHNPGFTKSESTVGPTFDALFSKAQGRVIMSTFSSNIHRVYQAISCGLNHNRKICVIGRSMERNLEVAMDLGYIKLPQKEFIDAHEVNRYNDNEVLIVTTGSQGEAMSALFRMATDEHRHVKIKPSDTVIISAKAIPGNEGSVSSVINHLLKAGAEVAYQDFSEIHVSGHAAQEEQKLMLRLTKPKFFLPAHGEFNHIAKHKDTAMKCGVPEKNILLMQDGDVIEVSPRYIKKSKSVKTGKVFIDNQINKQIENNVVIDRQKLATEGIVSIIAQVSEQDRTLLSRPKVSTFGLVSDRENRAFSKEIEDILSNFFKGHKKDFTNRVLENDLRQVVRKHISRKYKKYPAIVPTVFVM
jgi:ribonuclease J